MNYTRRTEITEQVFDQIRSLSKAKNADYAPGADTLHSFKQGAIIAGLTPFQYLFALVTKQFGAISTAIATNPDCPATNVESLDDKIIDVHVYMILLKCLIEDLQPEPVLTVVQGGGCGPEKLVGASEWNVSKLRAGMVFARADGTTMIYHGWNHGGGLNTETTLVFIDSIDGCRVERRISDVHDLRKVSA